MAEYISFDPNVEVLGQSMMSVIAGMSASARPLLAKYGLDALEADKWYKLQPILDFYREVSQSKNAKLNLTSTGTKVPEKTIFPPEIDSIQKAFQSLDEAYHINHRNGDIGHYHTTIVNNRQIDVLAETPFPCDLDGGLETFNPPGYFPVKTTLQPRPEHRDHFDRQYQLFRDAYPALKPLFARMV